MTDDAEKSRYRQLVDAAHEYGKAAMENLLRCRALGRAIIGGFPEYLGTEDKCVSLVPAKGPFDPGKDYGDDAFSFDANSVIRLEPITFGICVIIPHQEDSGSIWMRTGLRLEVTGDTFDIFVSNQPIVRVPLDFERKLAPVFDMIHKELMSVFCKDLAHFADERFADGFGFIPRRIEEL